MINMAVAIMVAAVVKRALRKVNMAIGNVSQRVKTESGERKMEKKEVQAPVRKRANIQREAMRIKWRTETILEGRATGEIG